MIINKLISVIIVTFNAEKCIAACLDSLAKNTNKNTEIIIIDGLSTDKTLGVIENYKDIITFLISEMTL